MVNTPSQTDTYNTALDIFDKTHPLRVDADENLKVTGTFTPSGTQDVSIISSVPIPVTQSGTWTVNLATEPTIDIGKVDQGIGGASPWLITGTVTANAGAGTFLVDGSSHTQPISGSISVSNFPVTQPVSGIVTALQGTSPWVVSGSITTSPNVNVHDGTGNSIGSTGASLNVNVTDFPAVQAVSQSGAWTVSLTSESIEIGTVDQGTPAIATNAWPIYNTVGGAAIDPRQIRLLTASDTITALQGTSPWVTSVSNFPATQNVSVVTALPAGTNAIGHIIADSGSTTAVTGNVTVIQPTGTNLHAVVDSGTITLSGTSPVSGTVTANQGTPNTPANKWPIEIVDSAGVNIASVDATGDVQVDVNNFPATQAVTQSGTWTVQPGNTANTTPWLTTIAQGSNSATVTVSNALKVDGSAVTQPISGTVSLDFPSGTLNNGVETAVAGSAVQILAANAAREKLILQNTGNANVRIGTTGVTTTTGFRLTSGATIIFDDPNCPTNAIFAIREGGASSIVLAQEIV